ncbi:MAG: GNAT family N-acetyltransferase [Candidatus Eremiobacteraeota bacterium]|nr:GNAT family N-acetyltransferase [Candidatus Eremiobacteraeota bacterium]
MNLAPEVETNRLILRAHRAGDLAACAAMWADPVVVRHIGGAPSTLQATWFRILRYGGMWPLLGYGYWAVEEKTSGRFIGELGFADFKREMQPSISGIPEFGWVLASAFHGKGYATESMRAAVAWSDKHIEAPLTVCIIDPQNVASVRVAQKTGYVEKVRSSLGGEETILFERARLLDS